MKSTQRSTLPAIGPAARRAAADMKGHAGQPADRHVAAVPAGAERAVLVLLRSQIFQPAVDGLEGRLDHVGPGFLDIAPPGQRRRGARPDPQVAPCFKKKRRLTRGITIFLENRDRKT